MEVKEKVAVVTGGAAGIGAALAVALADAGASVLIADLDEDGALARAAEIEKDQVIGLGVDVTEEEGLRRMLVRAEGELGPVDLFFANAGVGPGVGLGFSEGEWLRSLEVNVMAHVRAARLLIPGWLERGGGYFVSTASAAGLLTQIGSASYAVTKHAAVGFAEWLAVTYGDRGIGVSCVCPMGVKTSMLEDGLSAVESETRLALGSVTASGAVLAPEDVALATLAAIAEERFLVLPHPEVLEYFRHKGADYDQWLAGMARLRRKVDQSRDTDVESQENGGANRGRV
jgi:NAD(P)-dependent dehydrogenase (short-subunit alcohol dehydrogenase family)